jgi:5-formyltetrahydrofolate cyclo-ligase
METLEIQKAEIREQVRERLRLLGDAEKAALDHELYMRVMELSEIRNAGCVYAYASLKREAGTWEILRAVLSAGKRLALPRVSGEKMQFFYVSDLAKLNPGAFGIPEPSAECMPAEEPEAVVLVPGMAFTKDGKRLGKGGGYYDRFSEKEPDHLLIGLAYGFQVHAALPTEAHDRKVDMLVTPETVFS